VGWREGKARHLGPGGDGLERRDSKSLTGVVEGPLGFAGPLVVEHI
jgi:hypothetical protein